MESNVGGNLDTLPVPAEISCSGLSANDQPIVAVADRQHAAHSPTTTVMSTDSVARVSGGKKPGGGRSMSQTIVDEVFKDFLAQKLGGKQWHAAEPSPMPLFSNSVEKMKQVLDEEISELCEKQILATEPNDDCIDSENSVTFVNKQRKDMDSNPGSKSCQAKISSCSIYSVLQRKQTPSEEAGQSTKDAAQQLDLETKTMCDSDSDPKLSKPKKKKTKHKKKKHKNSHESDSDSEHKHPCKSRSRSPIQSLKSESSSLTKRKSRSRSLSWSRTERCSVSRSRSRSHDRKSVRSSSKSRPHSQKYSRSRSRSRSRSKRYSRSRSPRRHQSRSSSQEKDRHSGDIRRHQSHKYRHRSRSGERDRKRSQSRSGSDDEKSSLKIDKVKLHEIAVKKLIESGQAPKDEMASLRAGGKTVQELINFCKRISEKEKEESSSDESSKRDEFRGEDDDSEPFISHPFKIRDHQPNIVMNIRNAKPLPVLTPQEKVLQTAQLRIQFPVSSGSQHRAKESDWVPVEKNTSSLIPALPVSASCTSILPTPPVPAQTDIGEKVFPDSSLLQDLSITAIVSERMHAMQKLESNPNDIQALSMMYRSQEQANIWVQSKQLPGQFTGTTGAQIMSQDELKGPDKRFQAWAKKEQFQNAAPVKGGIGMFLLQKMGWKEGEGLGKNNEGKVEPLEVNVKIDRKGLTSCGEAVKKAPAVAMAKDLSGKHPVSALVELCNKRKWGPPDFVCVQETGPDHKKHFLFRVTVNKIAYQPAMPSSSKKTARAQAAIVCLQELHLLPRGTSVA